MKLTLAAPAKLNLDLRVLAREESGYHRIETLFLLVDLCDGVTLESAASGIELEVEGADVGATEDNLAYRAAEAFLNAAGLEAGVRIRLQKEIPAGAGLGGGSSDAAAVLRLMDALHPGALSAEALLDLGAALGSDVPFFLSGGAYALGWGRGGRLLVLPAPEVRWVVLAMPEVHVSTPEAYRRLSEGGLEPGRARQIQGSMASDWEWIADAAHNDFERVLFAEHPMLGELRQALVQRGANPARMTGSGSTLFGVFGSENRAVEVANEVGEAHGVGCRAVPTLRALPGVEVHEG